MLQTNKNHTCSFAATHNNTGIFISILRYFFQTTSTKTIFFRHQRRQRYQDQTARSSTNIHRSGAQIATIEKTAGGGLQTLSGEEKKSTGKIQSRERGFESRTATPYLTILRNSKVFKRISVFHLKNCIFTFLSPFTVLHSYIPVHLAIFTFFCVLLFHNCFFIILITLILLINSLVHFLKLLRFTLSCFFGVITSTCFATVHLNSNKCYPPRCATNNQSKPQRAMLHFTSYITDYSTCTTTGVCCETLNL